MKIDPKIYWRHLLPASSSLAEISAGVNSCNLWPKIGGEAGYSEFFRHLGWVVELVQSFLDVPRHGDVNILGCFCDAIVPWQCEATGVAPVQSTVILYCFWSVLMRSWHHLWLYIIC